MCGVVSFTPPIHLRNVQRDTFTVFLVNLYNVGINQGACYAVMPVTAVYGLLSRTNSTLNRPRLRIFPVLYSF